MATPRQVQRAKEVNLMDFIHQQDYMCRRVSNYCTMRCVFHREKTPSLAVYEDHYHCYSCGEHGDTISWVMKTMDLDFDKAVQFLNQQ